MPQTPEEQFRLTLVFNCLSAIASFSMAIVLYAFHLGKPDTHATIYMAASLFLVIGVWQTISFFNNLKLKSRYVKKEESEDSLHEKTFKSAETTELLPEAEFENIVPVSVTEHTTKQLNQKSRRKSP